VSELLMVLGLIVGIVAAAMVAWTSLLVAGMVLTVVGLVFGVLTGFWYHVVLARAVAAPASTPQLWLRPASLHVRLDEISRRRVMPWFYAGAAGFVVTVVGLAVFALGLAVGYLRQT
jgi:hypothetical protein